MHGAPVVADPAIHRGAPDQILGAIGTASLAFGMVRVAMVIAPVGAHSALSQVAPLKAPVIAGAAALPIAPVTAAAAVIAGKAMGVVSAGSGHCPGPPAGL